MLVAAKHYDPVIGIDIHIIQPPGPVPPVPVPHPFIGYVLDPMDYVPIVGATVFINGLPRGLAGTQGIGMPPHIPIGGTFVKPPTNECEIFMGVATICCDGDALSCLTMKALSCHCIGMPPIPRPWKKGSVKSLMLPTSTVMSIPGGPPVLIAGPPTISLMAMAKSLGKSALGKAFKKFKKSKVGKKIAAKVKNLKSKPPATNPSCGKVGEPVDVVTGANVDSFFDWQHPQYPHFTWRRFYSSNQASEAGVLGRGFRHVFQVELAITEEGFTYRDAEGDVIEFGPIENDSQATVNSGMRLTRIGSGQYELSGAMHPTISFGNKQGQRLWATRIVIADVVVELQYDSQNRLAKATDGSHDSLSFEYDSQNRLSCVQLMADRQRRQLASYGYDEAGRLTDWTDALEHQSTYEYDADHRMIRKTDRRRYSFNYTYDELGRCTRTWGDDGLYDLQLSYFPERQMTLVRWSDGGEYEYSYDEAGYLTKILDPAGGVTVFEIDDAGRVTEQLLPNGEVVKFLYDVDGANIGRVDASGQRLPPIHVQPNSPNGLARPLPSTPAGWMLGSRDCTAAGFMARKVTPAEVLDGWIASSMPTDAIPAITSLKNQQSIAPAQPLVRYDAMGRVTERIGTDGRSLSSSFDPGGNATRIRDADGSAWALNYKSWNLLDSQRDAVGSETKFDYNARESMTRVVDAGETTTQYAYDDCDRMTSVSRNSTLVERYQYNTGGELIAKYDASGNLLLQIEPGPCEQPAKITLADQSEYQFAYTPKARVQSVVAPDHAITFGYDGTDRIRMDARNGKGVEVVWDGPQTRVVKVLQKYKTSYRSLPDGRVEMVDPAGGVTILASDAKGRFARQSTDIIRELAQFDRRGLCLQQIVAIANQPTWIRSYQYSAAGDLVQSTSSRGGRTDFQYDAAHRLVNRRRNGRNDVYHHDAANNLIAKPGLTGVSLGKSNQVVAANEETLVYNDRGHLSRRSYIDGATYRYVYNSLDQLVEITSEDDFKWTAKYDGLQRRISKSFGNTFESHKVDFYWDDRRLAAEILDGQRLRIYIYADRDSFVPILMVQYDSMKDRPEQGHRFHLIADQRGQIVEVIDASGRSVWRAEAEPYGDLSSVSNPDFEFNLRMAGQYADEEVGLHYNRYRYYAADLGRFIQSDPIGLAGGLNTYAFAKCPLVEADLEGLSCGNASPPASSSPAKQSTPKTTAQANREASLAKGVPESQIGPSGKPKVHNVDHSSRKAAKDAARADGKSKPIQHPSDEGQKPHFHATDAKGEKIGKQSPHHTYPQSKK